MVSDELAGKPWRIERQIQDISDQLRSLALKNYHVFVQNQQCSQVIKTDLQTFASTVGLVEAELPRLLSNCEHLDVSVRAAATKMRKFNIYRAIIPRS